jgi:hypothetical protein
MPTPRAFGTRIPRADCPYPQAHGRLLLWCALAATGPAELGRAVGSERRHGVHRDRKLPCMTERPAASRRSVARLSWRSQRNATVGMATEVMATSTDAGQAPAGGHSDLVPLEELIRQTPGAHPIGSVDDLRSGAFETDDELDEFLAFVTRSRRADLA